MTILAKFRHFGNKNSNGQLVHYRRQNFDPTLANFYAIGQMYIIVNNQILKEKSSHLVTLARTNNLNCYWLIFSEICNWRPPNTSSRHPRPDRARVQRLEDGPSQRGHRAGGQRGQAGWGVRHHRDCNWPDTGCTVAANGWMEQIPVRTPAWVWAVAVFCLWWSFRIELN